jgi:4-hydroxythreonine-4-phosphate dehydrogenase
MKRIAITMGEPGGVGPEVALRAVEAMRAECEPVLVGDPAVFSACARGLHLSYTLKAVEETVLRESGIVHVLDAGRAGRYAKGKPSKAGGRACAAAIRRAVELALEGKVDALVTAPIAKEALRMAGLKWPGHTEMLAELTGTTDFRMMLMGGGLRVLLCTIHTSLASVPPMITRENVLGAIRMGARACRMLGIESPRIAVAGLNPHAGEGGMFGDEEETAIAPAVADAEGEGVPVSGPYPPDTLFFRAHRGEFDLVVCMYHDQGLIPLKLVAFETGVNVTVGLPIIRTSPDHGTAYDIAWKGGKADPSSMIEAIKAAILLKLSE